MIRPRGLHNLFGLGHSRKARRHLTAQAHRCVRPMLEALEDRLTPSTVILTAADAAALQTDLNNATAANTQYIINLTGPSSAYNLTAGQELTVSAAASGSNVSIVGSGQSITGNGNRVFFIDPGANVTLQNLTITGGSGVAEGGGVYVSGASTVAIIDSVISNNSVQNTTSVQNASGTAKGGGLYVAGSGWTVTLTGDTLSNNYAGGKGITAEGGAAYFSAGGGSCRLTILNNLSAPIADPSIMINNYVFAGAHGSGGYPAGGALYIGGASGASLIANIGNTAFYGNTVAGGYNGTSDGGGVYLGAGNVTMVNCTVAANSAQTSSNGTVGTASGGGIYIADTNAVTLDNNTISQNECNSNSNSGKGVFVVSGTPTLVNNIIRGNFESSLRSWAHDLDTNGITLSNATNNSIGGMSANAVNTTTNTLGENSQSKLGGVVGVNANGAASGGPIYYPLLSGTTSVGYGNTSVLSTIAAVEGTSISNATDAVGNVLAVHGSLDIGAVQVVLPAPYSPPPHHSPPHDSSSSLQGIINEVESLLSSLEAEIDLLLQIIQSILR